MKRIVVGILAHVDAGKTTLSEGFLYSAGVIDRLGRVDRRDAYLDTHTIERERGITVFSKQAVLEFGDTYMTLIDTPGHIDFSCEAERALSVQDYAILVVSAVDGVTAHTKTLWGLLAARRIPTFIFVNKLDISERRKDKLIEEIRLMLSPHAVDFTDTSSEQFYESAAAADESLIEEFFQTDKLSEKTLISAIRKRKIFPCFFGSALKMKGVDELLSAIDTYTVEPKYPEDMFGASVYKISRDKQDKRLTYMKIVGGKLQSKDTVTVTDKNGNTVTEKIEEIRVYSAERAKTLKTALPGMVVAVLGPQSTKVGDGIGFVPSDELTLVPVLDYRLILPKDLSPYETYIRLSVLTEEDPSLALSYDAPTHEIRVRLMGEIQLEVLTRLIHDRFGIDVEFDEGSILYKETVSDTVHGAGHFEPLRHYAEVHLRIDPLPVGSGIVSATECETDRLALNWQRLIMTHLEERVHRGVLTGSPLTDVKITLTAGRAHIKHTEGGDFRQATYRAVRQGLMKAQSVLLEPTFDYRIEVPREYLGKVLNDLTTMHAVQEPAEISETMAVVEGYCPVYTMRSYASELRAFTKGEGRITMTVGEYMPCHNAEKIIEERGYDPVTDERNPSGSVFCKAGAGYFVPWDEADELMHISALGVPKESIADDDKIVVARRVDYRGTVEEDKELMRIFESTYGKIKPRHVAERVENSAPDTVKKTERRGRLKPRTDDYVIVDGYNFIFAIDELRRIAESDLARVRDVLVRMMCDYAAFKKCMAIVVFDAYKRVGGEGSIEELGRVTVVYTKESETADAYIEKTTHGIADKHTVRVVTSDMQEQLVILGVGGLRVSAREFYRELCDNMLKIRETIESFAR